MLMKLCNLTSQSQIQNTELCLPRFVRLSTGMPSGYSCNFSLPYAGIPTTILITMQLSISRITWLQNIDKMLIIDVRENFWGFASHAEYVTN